jgi:histone acetyltransferase 1
MYKDIVGIDGDRRVLEPFHPTFTYPIFGDKEAIFGYKGLKVRVRDCAHLSSVAMHL